MKVTFRQLLTMLAIFDISFIVCASISFSLPQLSSHWRVWIHPRIFPWLLPAIQMSLTGSIWSTVSVSAERYISVVHPRHWVSSYSSAIYIIPVLLLTVSWNVTRFFELETCYPDKLELQSQPPQLCPTDLRRSFGYTRDYILIANFLGMVFLPFAFLVGLNYKLFITIKESGRRNQKTTARQKRDREIASLLILLVLVFGSCNIVRAVINFYEVVLVAVYEDQDTWPPWCNFLTFLSHLLLVINSSSSIVIYCWKDQKFRRILLRRLRLESRPRWRSGGSSNPGERRMTSPESGVTELVNISTVSTALPTNRMVASEVATRIAETQFLLKEEEEGREDFEFSKNKT